jgi:UDP-3-O-acyl-N-acetylglucosamine deacetylase
VDNVSGTHRRTTLGNAPVFVGLVEHVLGTLAGLHIDNCYIDLNASEPPGLDGSAQTFVVALENAGAVLQERPRTLWAVEQPVIVRRGEATLALYPPESEELRISYLLNYGDFSPIARQTFTSYITPATFATDIAPCRTFLLEEEAQAMRLQGLGARTKVTDLLVFGKHGPIDNHLRFADEPARHKVLDLLGDLFLLGQSLCGHVVGYRSGHPLNVELTQNLHRRLEQPNRSRWAA